MLIVKPIENPDVIVCQRHNESIILFSLDKQPNTQDQLFCLQCIREKTVIPKSVSWEDIKTMIQDRQEGRQRQFISSLKQIGGQIELFKSLIISIRSSLIQKLDSIVAITESWTKDITSQINYQHDYSLFEELKLLTQSQQQQLSESEKDQMLQIKKCNETFLKKLRDESKEIHAFQSSYQKLQEVILEMSTILKENYFEGPSSQTGNTQNPLMRCLCPKHSLQITHINLEKSIQKDQRTLCVECQQQNTITIDMFLQKWQNFEQEIQMLRKYKMHELQKVVLQKKNLISAMKANLNKEFDQAIQLFDKYMQNEISISNQPQMILNNNTQLDQIQEMAEILSQNQLDHKQDLNLQQRSSTLQQKAINHLASMNSNFMKMIEELKLQNEFIHYQLNDEDSNMLFALQQIHLTKHKGNCYAMAFNHQENIMIAGCNESIKVWEFNKGILKQGKEALSGHGDHVLCLVFSKQNNWFVSGGKDCALICWKQTEGKKWMSSKLYKVHTQMITCLIMTNQEDSLISSSADTSIIVWQIDQKKNELIYDYTLNDHTGTVYCLSFNKSQQLMVSCGFDKRIIIWSKHQHFEKWKFSSYINQSVQDFGCRICFIDDDLIAWTQHGGGFIHFFKEVEGKFQERADYKIQLNQSLQDEYLFPSIYHNTKHLLINRYKQFVYIFKKQIDGKFRLASRPIDCISSQNFGTLSPSGKFLVLWNKGNSNLSVYQLKQS